RFVPLRYEEKRTGGAMSSSLHVVKSELQLYEETSRPVHLAHAQRALQQLMDELRRHMATKTKSAPHEGSRRAGRAAAKIQLVKPRRGRRNGERRQVS